ncbi:HTH-type transcriptional regulator YodB [compost metagenome]
MEEDEIVHRQLVSEPSVKVVYALTEKGIALGPVVQALEVWSKDWVKIKRDKLEGDALEELI